MAAGSARRPRVRCGRPGARGPRAAPRAAPARGTGCAAADPGRATWPTRVPETAWRWSIYNIYKYIYIIYTFIYTIYSPGGQLRWRHVLRLGGVAALVQLLRLLWYRAEVEAATVRGAQQGPGEL